LAVRKLEAALNELADDTHPEEAVQDSNHESEKPTALSKKTRSAVQEQYKL
jgi:hypothetical protein